MQKSRNLDRCNHQKRLEWSVCFHLLGRCEFADSHHIRATRSAIVKTIWQSSVSKVLECFPKNLPNSKHGIMSFCGTNLRKFPRMAKHVKIPMGEAAEFFNTRQHGSSENRCLPVVGSRWFHNGWLGVEQGPTDVYRWLQHIANYIHLIRFFSRSG